MVDRTQTGSTDDQTRKAQEPDQVTDVMCFSQGYENASGAFHEHVIVMNGKGSASIENRVNVDVLLRGPRGFERSHGLRKAIDVLDVHVLAGCKYIPEPVDVRICLVRRGARFNGLHDPDLGAGLLQRQPQGSSDHGFPHVRIRSGNEDSGLSKLVGHASTVYGYPGCTPDPRYPGTWLSDRSNQQPHRAKACVPKRGRGVDPGQEMRLRREAIDANLERPH